MKKISTFTLIGATLFVLAACASQTVQTGKTVNVVTSFYPLYEIAKKVGGDYLTVKNLVPAGAEPHDYEPSPQDVIALNQAQLVIYNGAGLEPWADKLIPDLEKAGVRTLNESQLFNNLLTGTSLEESGGGILSSNLGPQTDPHIWLNPLQYAQEVKAAEEQLSQIDPMHADAYKKRAEAFIAKLNDLDQSYDKGLKNCKNFFFVTNHAAFAYLSARYNLEMIAIAGLSPDAEPSAKTLADLTELIKSKGIKYILVESLVSPKIAETLARETGAQTLVLNPLEGLTDEEIAQGKDYIAVMKDNLKNLQTAMQCE